MGSLIDVVSFVGLLMLVLLALSLAILTPVAIAQHRAEGRLANVLKRLRLSRMLGLIGVRQDDYLFRQKLDQLERQLDTCERCDQQVRCEEALQQTEGVIDMSFCPNMNTLSQLKRVA